MKLIIADDDADLSKLLGKVAEDAGWSAVSCADGRVLLESLRKLDEVSLILVDIRMPNLDGIEVAQSLGRGADLPRRRVRFMTGGPDASVEAATLIARARHIQPGCPLMKPFSIARFREVLAEEATRLS